MNAAMITGDVIRVQDNGQVIINRGEQDGVELGQRYQVFLESETMADPDTGERLGPIELVCGYGTVSRVQRKEAALRIDTARQDAPHSVDTRCRVRRIALKSPRSLYPQSSFYVDSPSRFA